MRILLGALFLSGFAGLLNQTTWQRSLKIYLAGSESAGSMIIVLVFMLGLGAGSLLLGGVAHRIGNAWRALGWTEAALAVINAVIALALALNPADGVYAFQRAAVAMGIPLRVVYGISATVVLLAPCFLMGITLPLASEATQRRLHDASPRRWVPRLFVVNTLGSVLGCLVAGFVLLPYLGQRRSLLIGACCNLAAAAMLLATSRPGDRSPAGAASEPIQFRRGRLSVEEVLAFWLGFLALAFEMYLFRVVSLAHGPLPYNFSLVLAYFLLFWSIGGFASARMAESITTLMSVAALLTAGVAGFYLFDRRFLDDWLEAAGMTHPALVSAAVYCLPCVAFGCLFGQVIARAAHRWGNDVGRFYGLNTLGSCLGVLVMSLIGFEFNPALTALLMAAGYLLLMVYARRAAPDFIGAYPRTRRFATIASLVVLGVLAPLYLALDHRPSLLGPVAARSARQNYYGRDGVIEVTPAGDLIWDGIWHSRLSQNGDHVGTSNWSLAVVPLLCRRDPHCRDALVIGLGTGITAAVLAQADDVDSVDVYEINHSLKNVLRDFPDGTLRVAENPKIRLIWQDARAGLALNPKRYDLITQQPLYLKQAGSSILLSEEYMELVKSRLAPAGVFCIYSNAVDNRPQALLVRKTAARVFPYCESFNRGYMIVASQQPIAFHTERILDPGRQGPLFDGLRSLGVEHVAAYHDQPRLNWDASPYWITDDHPLVEYPAAVRRLLATTDDRE